MIQLGFWWKLPPREIGESDTVSKTIVESFFSLVGFTRPLHWIKL